MGKPLRAKVGTVDSETVLGQARDLATLALVTLPTVPAPDYGASTVDGVVRGVVLSVTAAGADPNVTPPAAAAIFSSDRWGRVAFHAVLPATGTADLEVWANAGKDAADADIGWLLVSTVSGVVSRKEYVFDVGQRPTFFRLTNTANIDGAHPATIRATGVV